MAWDCSSGWLARARELHHRAFVLPSAGVPADAQRACLCHVPAHPAGRQMADIALAINSP